MSLTPPWGLVRSLSAVCYMAKVVYGRKQMLSKNLDIIKITLPLTKELIGLHTPKCMSTPLQCKQAWTNLWWNVVKVLGSPHHSW